MSDREYDDDASQHKYTKTSNVKARSAALTGALLVGLLLGVMASEKLYLIAQETDAPGGGPVAGVRSRKLEVGAAATAVAGSMRRTGGKPRNKLEEILRQVAPSGEVMIVISDMNLIHEDSLKLWLQVW